MTAPLRTVHVRVNDAATGKPTPVRIRLTDSQGEYYAPLGRLTDFATERGVEVGGNLLSGGKRYAYIDGSCEVRLPPGAIHVEISKGPEYRRIDTDVILGVGQLALRFTMERWADVSKEGWYAGDTRAHFLSPHAALLEGAAEGLAVVHLLALDVPASGEGVEVTRSPHPRIPNILAFSGQRPALESEGCSVAVNTSNRHPVLGSLGLLHCHRLVFPLRFGGPDGGDDWTLADWCDQCHRKGGLVVWSCKSGGLEERNGWGEALADLLLGKIDALEIASLDAGKESIPDELTLWYQLLNAGFRVPLAGASSKADNCGILGSLRTYVSLATGEPFSLRSWVESLRSGRAFITDGPLMDFSVDALPAGSVIRRDRATSVLHVRAQARSERSYTSLELVVNGAVAAAAQPEGPSATAAIETALDIPQGGWIACRCWGPAGEHTLLPRLIAHSSPAYVSVSDSTPPGQEMARSVLLEHLAKGESWVNREGRFDNDRQRAKLLELFAAARSSLTNALVAPSG